MVMASSCPKVGELSRFASGEFPADKVEPIFEHLEKCEKCLESVLGLTSSDTLLEMLARAKTMPDGPDEQAVSRLVDRLSKFGRSVAPNVGSSPMSVVCSACRAKLKVKAELAGKKLKCPKCKAVVAVPGVPESGVLTNPDAKTGGRPDRFVPETLVQGPADTPMKRPARPLPVEITEGMETEAEEEVLWDFLAPAEQIDELGRLGGYRVLEVLGHGGMGVVFKAEDPGLQRHVALKAMLPAIAASPSARRRFLREARAAAAIKHDNIVSIHQVGEDRGVPFMAIEFLHGETLDDRLAREGALPLPEVLRIGRQICDGLAAAHGRDLIHRDIKPANIWLESGEGQGAEAKGRVKLLDFGLARSTSDDTHLTQQGSIVGTPAYMAPQQAMGEAVDHRCDLFSLGCVLYRMSTGELPFKGANSMAILSSLAMDTPRMPIELNAEMPPELSELVVKLLAKNPNERPATAVAVGEALRAIERGLAAPAPAPAAPKAPAAPVQKKPPVVKKREDATAVMSSPAQPKPMPKPEPVKPRSRRGLLVAAAALVGIGLLVAGIVFFLPAGEGTIRVEVNDKDIKVSIDDGEFKIVGADKTEYKVKPGEHGLRVKQGDKEFDTDKFVLKKGETVTLKVEWIAGEVKVVRDGKEVGVKPVPGKDDPVVVKPGKPFELKKPSWEADKSAEALPGMIPHPALLKDIGRWQVIPVAATGSVFAVSPDGLKVAVLELPYLRIYDAKTGTLTGVGRLPRTPNPLVGGDHNLDWSADSRWIRTGHKRGVGWDNVHLFSTDGSLAAMSYIQHQALDFGWNPKHPLLAGIVHGYDRISVIDPAREKPLEIQTALGGNGKAAWSPDGEWLLVVREDKTAQIYGRDGKPGVKLEGVVDPALTPVWSPDGGTIAAMKEPNVVGFWKKDGKADKATAKYAQPVKTLAWNPDGKLLAIAEADAKLHFCKPDGTEELTLDTKLDGNQLLFQWVGTGRAFYVFGRYYPNLADKFIEVKNDARVLSPDGKFLVNVHPRSIGISELKGGETVDLEWRQPWIDARHVHGHFSPDSKRLFVASMDGFVVHDVRSGKELVRLGNGVSAGPIHLCAFSPRGDRLALGTRAGQITICDPTGVPIAAPWQPLRLSDDPKNSGVSYFLDFLELCWHPDGRHLLAVVADGSLIVFDTQEGKQAASTKFHGQTRSLFAPDNPDNILLLNPGESAVWRWKTEREPFIKVPGILGPGLFANDAHHLGPVPVSPDGKLVLCWPAEGMRTPILASTDLKTRTQLVELKNFEFGHALNWLPDGKQLLAGTNPISIRSLDGKLVEEIKPVPGVNTDRTGKLILSPDRKTFLGNSFGTHFLYDVATKKLSPLPGIRGDSLVFSPDGKFLVGVEGSTVLHWNLETKALERELLLLPDRQFAVFSAAGEVLGESAKAKEHYRYLVEDKTGKLTIRKPAEFPK